MNHKLSTCCTCGYSWRTGMSGDHSCSQYLSEDLAVTNKILEEVQRVLDAIPECEIHGKCVPHAIEWIEKAKQLEKKLAANITGS